MYFFIIEFQNQTFFLNLAQSWLKCANECYHQIICPKWHTKCVSHGTRAVFSYGGWSYLTWTLPQHVFGMSPLHIWHLCHPFSSALVELGLAVSLVWPRHMIKLCLGPIFSCFCISLKNQILMGLTSLEHQFISNSIVSFYKWYIDVFRGCIASRGMFKGDVFLIPGAAQRAGLCIQHH